MTLTRARFLQLLFAAAVVLPLPAAAADWKPTGPMDMVVTYGPGGAYDIIARAMGKYWEKYVGTKLIVKNVAGAGGSLGVDRVVKSRPNGQVVGITSQSTYLGELIKSHFPWNIRDVPILLGGIAPPYAVSTGVKSPFKTWDDVRKANRPVRIGVASQLTTELVLINDLEKHGRKIVTASMKTAAIVTGLQSGDIDLWIANSSDVVMTHVKQGTIRPLLVFDTERAAHLPDTPIHTEVGMPEEWSNVAGTRIWFAPTGTPADVQESQAKKMRALLADPELMKWNKERGFLYKMISGNQAKKSLIGFYQILEDNKALLKKYGG